MKKILMLNNEQYDGLKCYRMEKAGPLELLRVLNDGPAYWLVMIRSFDPAENGADRAALLWVTPPWGNGVWRYLDEKLAYSKFEQLSQLPIFLAESKKAEETANKRRERLAAVRYDPQDLLKILHQVREGKCHATAN
jgi:hypothetical protein